MSEISLFDRISVFVDGKDALVKEIKSYLADKSVSIDERWSLFIKAESILPIDSWVISLNEVEKHGYEYYDDFYYERYEYVSFSSLISDRVLDDPKKFYRINVNKLKEEILATGYAGFKYDW